MPAPGRLEADILASEARTEWINLHGTERQGPWPRLITLDTTQSTNEDAIAMLADGTLGGAELPDATGTLVVTLDQQGGKGRMGRGWEVPAGSGVAMSLVIQAPQTISHDSLAMASTLVGLIWREVLATAVTSEVALKWPNDLLIDGKKVAGVLAQVGPVAAPAVRQGELAPPAARQFAGGISLVVGIGTNLTQTQSELPVPTATSLALHHNTLDPHQLVAAFWARVTAALAEWLPAGGPLEQPLGALENISLLEAARQHSATVGADVRVLMPNNTEVVGIAEDIDAHGHLVLKDRQGATHTIAAGDVVHVRRTDGSYA